VRFVGGVFGDDGKDDFAGAEVLHALFASQHLAIRGKDGGDANQILSGDAGVAQGQLERC
jgi:hypothetical protein